MATERPIRFAVIGCGLVAPAHVRALAEVEGAEVAVVCARSETRLVPFADQYGLEWSTDLDAVLARDDIDVIDVTAPPFAHEELVTRAAAAGKHVVLEKPIATSVESAERLIGACNRAGVKLAVIFQNRWRKSTALLKRCVDRGDLGELLLGDVYVKWFRPQAYYDSDAWRGTTAGEGGGALINQGIHYIDAMQWIMGPVDWVFGQTVTTGHHEIEVEDLGVATIRWRNGALGVIEASTALLPGIPDRISVHGTKGSVVLSGGKVQTWQVEGMDEAAMMAEAEEPTGTGASDPMAFPIAWHRQQLQDMVEAIREDREPAVNGPEGLRALRIVQAIYESSCSGRKVLFDRD